MAKKWTAEECEYLETYWGIKSIKLISKALNRSPNAIKSKAWRMGLGAFLDNGEYITFNQLLRALCKNSYSYVPTSWLKNRGFPVKYKTVDNCRFRIVYLNDFWGWADKHRNFIDWSKVEENILGVEPEWVKEQRRISILSNRKYHTTPWTPAEDNLLKMLLKQFRYTYKELSERLHRTEGAIQRRINDLKLKERPIKADNHIKWTQEEYDLLHQMVLKGYSYELMSEKIGKSAKAIRGKVYTLYGSENLDKARQSILQNSNRVA